MRQWRTQRHRSQLDLALDVGVSPRHLSFVETGRSRPSPELVLALADRLEVPLRERNVLLVAAGYAPHFAETALDARSMDRVRGALERVLAAHTPYPGVVVDRRWNIVMANAPAAVFLRGIPTELLGPPPNVFRLCLHPDGFASRTLNFEEWSTYLMHHLQRLAAVTGDARVMELLAEVRGYPGVAAASPYKPGEFGEDPPLVIPLRLEVGGVELSLFTTMTTFGTPQDITLAELAIELFYPEDEATESWLRSSAASLSNG